MPPRPASNSRRNFLRVGSMLLPAQLFSVSASALIAPDDEPNELDRSRIRNLAAWTTTAQQEGPNPVPYASQIFDTKSGVSLLRALNAVGPDHDPSAHAEIVAIRTATKKLQTSSLRGYTLYTTCEPCPMCMSCCLWAQVDRVVYGATIADAARFGHQIMIPSAEVARRCDIPCIVDGPVERDRCVELFTNPTMQKALQRWKK